MLKELEEMSKGQKLYNYECKSCGFEKGVPEFILEELRQDAFFSLGAIASLNEKNMPELICPNCEAKVKSFTDANGNKFDAIVKYQKNPANGTYGWIIERI